MKKKPTKAESDHMGRVADLGCMANAVGLNTGRCGMPAQVHHIHGFAFGSKSNWRVAPLCSRHHNDGEFGHCVHMGTRTFEENYMTEAKMLEIVNQRLSV